MWRFWALFVAPFLAYAAVPTNTEIQLQTTESRAEFRKPFEVEYVFPEGLLFQTVDLTNFDFAKHSVALRLLSSNAESFRLRVEPWDVVELELPPLLVTAISNGKPIQMFTPTKRIPVQPLPSNEIPQKARPLQKPFFLWDSLWTWLLALSGIVVASGCLLWYYIRHSRRRQFVQALPQVDPYEAFYQEIVYLTNIVEDTGDEATKEFFVRLSEAIRRFLEGALFIPALETPTKGILRFVRELHLSRDLMENIEYLLRLSDRVKFAKYYPDMEQRRHALNECRALESLMRSYQNPNSGIVAEEPDASE